MPSTVVSKAAAKPADNSARTRTATRTAPRTSVRAVKPSIATKPVPSARKAPAGPVKAPARTAKVSPRADLPKQAPSVAKSVSATKEKSRKSKLVRDSFTMPELEYAALSEVKKACLKAGFEVKKSELLRIGVALIRKLDPDALQRAVAALSPLKPGRPRKEK